MHHFPALQNAYDHWVPEYQRLAFAPFEGLVQTQLGAVEGVGGAVLDQFDNDPSGYDRYGRVHVALGMLGQMVSNLREYNTPIF